MALLWVSACGPRGSGYANSFKPEHCVVKSVCVCVNIHVTEMHIDTSSWGRQCNLKGENDDKGDDADAGDDDDTDLGECVLVCACM